MSDFKCCPHCASYMHEMTDPEFKDWKRCPTCNFCWDKNGCNNMFPNGYKAAKSEEVILSGIKQCLKLCSSESVECTCNKEK